MLHDVLHNDAHSFSLVIVIIASPHFCHIFLETSCIIKVSPLVKFRQVRIMAFKAFVSLKLNFLVDDDMNFLTVDLGST